MSQVRMTKSIGHPLGFEGLLEDDPIDGCPGGHVWVEVSVKRYPRKKPTTEPRIGDVVDAIEPRLSRGAEKRLDALFHLARAAPALDGVHELDELTASISPLLEVV